MKFVALNLIFCLIMSPIVTQDPSVDEPLEGKGIFQYNPDGIQEFWFFPKDKARWDGASITAKEWNLLTKTQKTGLIVEYIEELERTLYIVLQIDAMKYMIGLDNYVDECEDQECLQRTMISFIDELLEYEGIVLRDIVVIE